MLVGVLRRLRSVRAPGEGDALDDLPPWPPADVPSPPMSDVSLGDGESAAETIHARGGRGE